MSWSRQRWSPETWFFRDPPAILGFARMVKEKGLQEHASGVMRILSLACASGEGTLFPCDGVPGSGRSADGSFSTIDGIDISERLLDKARARVYGANSFRGSDCGFRDRHFTQLFNPGNIFSTPRVAENVRFYRGNLAGEDFVPAQPSYDCIFCRNVLIYFESAARRHAYRQIEEFVGPGWAPFSLDQPKSRLRSTMDKFFPMESGG